VPAGDASLGCASRQAVKTETTGGFPAAVKARNGLAVQIDNLAICVDSQPRPRIVDDWSRPSGVEWRPFDLILRRRFAEIQVFSTVYKAIVSGDGPLLFTILVASAERESAVQK
jgi:hypothetical protein